MSQAVVLQFRPINRISEIVQKVGESFHRDLSAYTQPSGGQEAATSESPKVINILRTTTLTRKQF